MYKERLLLQNVDENASVCVNRHQRRLNLTFGIAVDVDHNHPSAAAAAVTASPPFSYLQTDKLTR